MMAEVWFFSGSHRKNGPPHGNAYRPHLVIQGQGEYLGAQFVDLCQEPFGEHILCEIKLPYRDVDYSGLTEGTAFEIREGAHVVGEGIVLSPHSHIE